MPELALEVRPHRGPLVGLRADELLQVVPGAPMLSGAGQYDDAHVVVRVGPVERRIQRVDQRGVLRVRGVRPVHRDPGDRPLDLVLHDLLSHRAEGTTGPSPECLSAIGRQTLRRTGRRGNTDRMTVQLNHTIVWCRDKARSAAFFTEVFGRPAGVPFGPFLVVEVDNGVSLDFHTVDEEIVPQHYAFLVGEDEFDAIFGRVLERGLEHWADPLRSQPGEINHHDGGRGVYFEDPDRHVLEIITRPYGSG